MGTITLKNTWKNLTLVATGALMETLIAVPLGGIASADDDPNDTLPYISPVEAPTYAIRGSKGLAPPSSWWSVTGNDAGSV